MGTSKRFKPENLCTKCLTNVANMTSEQQEEHEKNCKMQRTIEKWMD